MDKKKYLEQLQEQKEQLEYQINLVKNDWFSSLKHECQEWQLYPFISKMARRATFWLGCLERNEYQGKKIDKRRKYEEKTRYEMINEGIREFVGHDVTVHQIIDYNFSQAFCYHFKYNDKEYYIQVPNPDGLTYEKFDKYGEYIFQICLYEVNGIYSAFKFGYRDREEFKSECLKFFN